jgi:hypothetical protein
MAANSSEILVTAYKPAKYENTEDSNFNSHHCRNLKFHDLTSKQVSRNAFKLAIYIKWIRAGDRLLSLDPLTGKSKYDLQTRRCSALLWCSYYNNIMKQHYNINYTNECSRY